MIKFEVTKRFSTEVAFTAEIDCAEDALPSIKLGLVVKWAFRAGADLSGADLSGAYLGGANLGGADLRGAYLVDGGQRSDGYRFVGWIKDDALRIVAGCRNFTIDEARTHWLKTRAGTPLGDETMAILNHIELVAGIRRLTKSKP